jgi:hypothetical protein
VALLKASLKLLHCSLLSSTLNGTHTAMLLLLLLLLLLLPPSCQPLHSRMCNTQQLTQLLNPTSCCDFSLQHCTCICHRTQHACC